MQGSPASRLARDLAAWLVVLVFVFPLFWWVLASVKPYTAIFAQPPVYVDFEATAENYAVTIGGQSRITLEGGVGGQTGGASSYYSLPSIRDSVIVALGSTALALVLATLASFGLSRFAMRGKDHVVFFVLAQRMLPPIAVAIPLFFIFRDLGLRDSHLGLILAHTLINLPLAVLLLKSFFDDVPVELDESAMLDGATRFQVFRMVVLPLVKGGLAATAVLCFIFSWTEFLISLLLTTSIRTIPVKITTFVTSTGTEWGLITALGSAALVPSFIFILLVQKHLVRGLTLGSLKS
ncbi:MAG: carbohydrate ABC transporter permease [Geminicoccaceae bacterium]|jgi:multiple sugar transport system permease protein|nr:carbohydrate ABC transporter permease [Geminicoccaceae bacterium]MCB9969819.1 carbohydrate ABC transporter permease [Geminicoccaceae bacterium]HRY25865.1 carbohydrate ABC transporter permease [Geminicoccaceae bacterium]